MKGKILLISIISATLLLALSPAILNLQALTSYAEADVSAVVYRVIDGDTFDAFPVAGLGWLI